MMSLSYYFTYTFALAVPRLPFFFVSSLHRLSYLFSSSDFFLLILVLFVFVSIVSSWQIIFQTLMLLVFVFFFLLQVISLHLLRVSFFFFRSLSPTHSLGWFSLNVLVLLNAYLSDVNVHVIGLKMDAKRIKIICIARRKARRKADWLLSYIFTTTACWCVKVWNTEHGFGDGAKGCEREKNENVEYQVTSWWLQLAYPNGKEKSKKQHRWGRFFIYAWTARR